MLQIQIQTILPALSSSNFRGGAYNDPPHSGLRPSFQPPTRNIAQSWTWAKPKSSISLVFDKAKIKKQSRRKESKIPSAGLDLVVLRRYISPQGERLEGSPLPFDVR